MSTRLDPVSGRCVGGPAGQPGLIRLQNWTLANYGGQALGVYSCRTVRGGKGMSVHSEGRAFDWRAPNRAVLDGYFQTLVQHADALNLQAIHDYDNNRRWTGKGWQKASIGKAPYKWETHVERNWDGARDARPIADIIRGQATPTTPFPPSLPPNPQPPPITTEDDEDMIIIQPGKSRTPNRPAYAQLLKSQRQILLKGPSYNECAALGGDRDVGVVYGVQCRVWDIPTNAGIDGWCERAGGVTVLDSAGAEFSPDWT